MFSVLLRTSVSESVREILNYYGAVAACIRGRLCDKSTICEAVVPEITSIQSDIVRAGDLNGLGKIGVPAGDKQRWTEADRVLSACQS